MAQILECTVPQTVGAASFFPHFNLFFWRTHPGRVGEEGGAKGDADSMKCHKKQRPFVMMAAAVSQLYYCLRQPVHWRRQTSSKVSVQLLKTGNTNKDQWRAAVFPLFSPSFSLELGSCLEAQEQFIQAEWLHSIYLSFTSVFTDILTANSWFNKPQSDLEDDLMTF